MKRLLIALFTLTLVCRLTAAADNGKVRVGVATLLSGDWAGLGQNIVNTAELYRKFYLRHPIEFVYEDAKISGVDGLKAYQKLINVDHVDVLIGGTSSNGTMAGAPLINSSKTVMITPVTGGSNVDGAGEWIFRIGNSDVLNATQQAALFKQHGISKVALLAEETEYTQDIAQHFEQNFVHSGGRVTYKSSFSPGSTDFRSQLTKLLASKPEALFVPTQTGSALALVLEQLAQLGQFHGEVHTTFTAADNPEAKVLAKGHFKGVYYLAPAFDKDSPRLKEFLRHYREEFKKDPLITFHAAATMDALDLLQAFLDKEKSYDAQRFHDFLLTQVKSYKGLMGEFAFDAQGNANTGFVAAQMQ